MGLVAKTARDAYFLSRFEKSLLPLMFLAIAIVIAPILTYYTSLSKKLPPKTLFMITCSIFGASFIFLQTIMTGNVIPVAYIWIEVAVGISIIQFWTYAGESFEPQQAKRLFGIIGGGGSFAVMLIGMNLKPFVNAFGTDELLFLSATFLGLAFTFGTMCMQYFKKDQTKGPKKPTKKTQVKKKMDPFIIGIATIVALSAIVTTLVDYQFKMIASSSFPKEADLVAFFGTFYSIAGAASIVMQFFVTGPLLSRFGVLLGLLILPFFLILGSTSILLAPLLLSASFAKFSDQTFKFTINNSSMELIWLPVPADVRKTFKPQVSGTIKSIAEGLGGLTTFFLVKVIALPYLSIVCLGSIMIWLFTAFKVKTGYVSQLQTAIAKRQIDFEELTIDVQDPAMVKTIEETLSSDDEIKQLFALEIIEGLPLSSWKKTINQLFKNGTPEVRKRILSMAWDEDAKISNEDIIQAVKQIVSDCTFNRLKLGNMPMFDVEYIFLQIRSKSVGEVSTLKLLCPDDKETYVNVDVDLSEVMVHVDKGHNPKIELTKEMGMIMTYPTIDSLSDSGGTDINASNMLDVIGSCILQIYDKKGEEVSDAKDQTKKELIEFVEQLNTKQFEKVEDPDYIIKNGIPIDYIYYFEHQFKSAIQTIFEPMMEDVTELWKDLIPEKVKKIRKKKTA